MLSMKHTINSDIEQIINDKIAEIENKIEKLEKEKRQLSRYKTLGKIDDIEAINENNSIIRVFVESRIIEILNYYKTPITTAYLFENIKHHIINDLKPNTFRVYLHRMKKKGIIRLEGRVGNWVLAKKD